MKKTIYLILISAIFVCGVAPEQDSLVSGSSKFALKLYQELASANVNSNLVFSPYSISQALGMTYDGAKKDTRLQMQKVLGFPVNNEAVGPVYKNLNDAILISSDSLNLHINNGLWAQKGYKFLPDYFNQVKSNYDAPLEYVNYNLKFSRSKATKAINKWVKKSTNNKIEELLKPDDLVRNTRLVLVNAIWFNAQWAHAFKKEETREVDFKNLDNTKSMVQMMYQKGKFEYFENESIQTIRLAYKGNKFDMLVLLPKRNIDFEQLEKSISLKSINEIEKQLLTNTVELGLPKFEAESDLKLKPVLRKMGMSLAFSDTADFSGMTGDTDLKIDKVIHKSFIEVSEEGTEAAAATAVTMVRKTAIVENIKFIANKPFIYLIKDKMNDNILFVGRYVKGE